MKPVDDHIRSFPPSVQDRLQSLRLLIMEVVPEAEEGFSYNMPAYHLAGKPLVYFAGYAKHIGVYALPVTHAAFADRLSAYKQGKGSVQFPHNQPLPLDLIRQMIEYRASIIRQSS